MSTKEIKLLERFLKRKNASLNLQSYVLGYAYDVRRIQIGILLYLLLLVAQVLTLVSVSFIFCLIIGAVLVIRYQMLRRKRAKSITLRVELLAFEEAQRMFIQYYGREGFDLPYHVREVFLSEVEETLPPLLFAAVATDWRDIPEQFLEKLRVVYSLASSFVELETFDYLLDIADKD
ncbi:MAG: hypothetical protein Q7R64_03660 [bacterium]|nr:hypothetical protein [bacterium]